MSSKIPQPKPVVATRHQPDLQSIQTSLHALHAPSITLDELSRLVDGPLGEALVFICEHVKGRKGVADARKAIHAVNQRQGKARIPGVSHGRGESLHAMARSSTDKAYSRLSAEKTNVKVYEAELSEQRASISSSQEEAEKLQRTLDEKLRVGTLLRVLRDREEVRIRRFTEITRLIRDLRKVVSDRGSPVLIPTKEPIASTPHDDAPLRYNNIRDTLANLHAHHVRLSHLTRETPPDNEARLRESIARRMGCSVTDKRVVLALNKFLSAARLRAAQKVKYHQTSSKSPSTAELGKLIQGNKAKEQALQYASDMSIALQFRCGHFTQSTTAFLHSVSALRLYVEAEARQAHGYIDVHRNAIVSSLSVAGTDKTFVQCVREALGITGAVPSQQVLKHVEDVMRRVHRREAFLAGAQLDPAPPPADDIAEYRTRQRAADARLATVLGRTLGQAKAGDKIVGDIEVLVEEANALAGMAKM